MVVMLAEHIFHYYQVEIKTDRPSRVHLAKENQREVVILSFFLVP